MRVFVGPVEIAGYYGRLAEALRGIGVDAVAVDLGEHRFGYAREKPASIWVRAAVWAERSWIGSRGRPRLLRLPSAGIRVATRLALVAWSITRFDAYIFGYGTTLLFTRELPLLRVLGKRLVFVFNGSDARPPYIDGADMAPSRGLTIDDCIALARRKKALIRRIERYADAVVSLPTFSHFFEKPVIDYLLIGTPVNPRRPIAHPGDPSTEIRVLHSPSDPEVKGSERVRDAVAGVRSGGLPIKLIELVGVPHETVLLEIARADFVIDQAFSDAPMAVFAAEAAAAGVPAIVGSYAWSVLVERYGNALPPVEASDPDDLEVAVARLSTDTAHRVDLGRRAREFIASAWAPEVVAGRYIKVLAGETPTEWLFDPKGVRYTAGVLPMERSRAIVAAIVRRAGLGALQLSDKPELELAFGRMTGVAERAADLP
jgi:glycosyltransferase involved in cell wall biosynthesis